MNFEVLPIKEPKLKKKKRLPRLRKFFKWSLILSGTALFLLLAVGAILFEFEVNNKPNQPQASSPSALVQEPLSEASLYNAVSEQRRLNAVPALSFSQELNSSAKAKCDDMVRYAYYDHTNPVTKQHGYEFVPKFLKNAEYVSENLNSGSPQSAKSFVDSWMGSPSHKAAIIDPKYTLTGFAICDVKGQVTVVEHFASTRKEQPQIIQQAPARNSPTVCNSYPGAYGTSITTYCF